MTTPDTTPTVFPKNTIYIWLASGAEEAARFYAQTFPDTEILAERPTPSDNPSTREGDILSVEMRLVGLPCVLLNGGPAFPQSECFSMQIATKDQEETDRYWNAITQNGGQESECGWCKDRWGVSWQITPITLLEALAKGGDEARRAFDAVMRMQKLDCAAIDAARAAN